nr:TetR/AcrR family transcriptional regulator [Sphingomonas sp. CDS-1]
MSKKPSSFAADQQPVYDDKISSERGRGRPVGDREAKKGELLAAATAVIAEVGYAGASLRKVADRAGYTTGAVTYYFANKEEMITAVAESMFDEFDKLMPVEDARFDLREILEEYLHRANLNDSEFTRLSFELLAHARHEPAFRPIIEDRYAKLRAKLANLLARGQKAGTIRNDIAADLLADQLAAMSDGWSMMFPVEEKRFKPKRLRGLLDATIALVSPYEGREVDKPKTGSRKRTM